MKTKLFLKTLRAVTFTATATIIISAPAQIGGYTLDWFTVAGGGGAVSGGDYTLVGTVGQPDAGHLSGGDYAMEGGFWAGVISAPTLSITRAGGEAILSWTGNSFVLQNAADVSGPWTDLSPGVSTDGVHYGTNSPISGRGTFFRLRAGP